MVYFRLPRIAGLIAVGLLSSTALIAQQPTCVPAGTISRLGTLPEASGLAASRRTPRMFWAQNDSGDPMVFALNEAGQTIGRVRITGVTVHDWEDIAIGPCPQGSCLYIADIGDNNGRRPQIVIYRVPEPAPGDTRTTTAEAMRATYADGPQDAEAVIALPDGTLLIVTKGDTGPVALYRFPTPFQNGGTVSLQRLAVLVPSPGTHRAVSRSQRVTGGSSSADGREIVLRTNDVVMFYDARDFSAGRIHELSRIDVTRLREPQGEGIAIAANGDVWLSGEGGDGRMPGTLAHLSCARP